MLVLAACGGGSRKTETPVLFSFPPNTHTPIPTPTTTPAPGLNPRTYWLVQQITAEIDQSLKVNCLLYLPSDYYFQPEKTWPLILFLHGGGEAGTDLEKLKQTGLPEILVGKDDFPFIVVSPQIPAPPEHQDPATMYDIEGYLNSYGWKQRTKMLSLLVDELIATLQVDPRRIYLTGISLGGFGTWAYLLKEPDRFTAAIPIAGGYHFTDFELPENLCLLKDLPIWVFHGDKDSAVQYQLSEILVNGLKACGSVEVKFTLVPDGEHDVWSDAYADPLLWDWLLSKAK